LPEDRAPTIAISRFSTIPNCTGSSTWQTGQMRYVVSPSQSGHTAVDLRPSAAKSGPTSWLGRLPKRSSRTGSRRRWHCLRVRLSRLLQRKRISLGAKVS
jgi:hypothetical protein